MHWAAEQAAQALEQAGQKSEHLGTSHAGVSYSCILAVLGWRCSGATKSVTCTKQTHSNQMTTVLL